MNDLFLRRKKTGSGQSRVAVTVQDNNTTFSSLERTARRGELKVSVKSKGVKTEIDSQGQIKFLGHLNKLRPS